jgi:hypothetical protein
MKFYAYVQDKTLNDCNGGSIVLNHHLHALKELGNETGLLNLSELVPRNADYIIFQSEWWGHLKPYLEMSNVKRVCWLGHYKETRYGMPKIKDIKADYYYIQWKGDCVKWGEEQTGKKIYYLPHGGCSCMTEGKEIKAPKAVFVGNHYPERKEDWIDYAQVTRMNSPIDTIKNLYKSSIVCPTIHGDFQKNKTTDWFFIPGEMINDRIFQIILSGGFAISDNTRIVSEFFEQDEVPQAKDKEQFKWFVNYFTQNPDDRLPYMKKAKERILKEHLYKKRWKELLENFISEKDQTQNQNQTR